MGHRTIFTFNKDDEKLVGVITKPKCFCVQDKYPTILLVHGFGVDKSEYGLFDVLSKSLSDSGFLVYRFDFSGCGESEGDYSKTTLTKLKDDLSCIIDFLKAQNDVDIDDISIIAQSFGTSVVVALNPIVKSVVFMGSISNPKELFKTFFDMSGSTYNPDGVSKRVRSDGRVTEVGPEFWKDLDSYNLIDDIKNIKCPLLFINGSNDMTVPISQRDGYFENLVGDKDKIVIDGANHNLKPKWDEVSEIILKWFKK